MENYITDLIKKSLLFYDNKNEKYKKFLKNTKMSSDKKIFSKITDEEIDSTLSFETEILGLYHHNSNVFIWSWSLPYLKMDETKITRELLNYGLRLEPNSNTISHFFIKSLLINARNKIESDFDLELIQSIASYILKDKYDFIYPTNTYNNKNKIITTYFLVKISNI
jgi:hypothetical protein